MDSVLSEKVHWFITAIQSVFNKNRKKKQKDDYEDRRFIIPRFGTKWVRLCYYNVATWKDRADPRIRRKETGSLHRFCRILVGEEDTKLNLKKGDVCGPVIASPVALANVLTSTEQQLRSIIAFHGLLSQKAISVAVDADTREALYRGLIYGLGRQVTTST